MKEYVEKVYIVSSLRLAKYLLNECHFKLINARAEIEGDHRIMFRFEDTPELHIAIDKFNKQIN